MTINVNKLWIKYPLDTGFRIAGSSDRNVKDALKGISFSIKDGERVGLVGRNGAGKSTLLKAMAGILPPSSGSVDVQGAVAPLFEFATGFEMDQTGYENIKIRSLLQGQTIEQIRHNTPFIAEFSELGDALNQPVRTYSSGMFVRLAFSTATSIEPDILLIDEAYGAGDQHFSIKSANRMNELMRQGRILVFTSHNLGLIEQLCDRVIWLREGEIFADGPASQIVPEYIRTEV